MLNWKMDRILNLLINSAILVICMCRRGAEEASRTRAWSA